MTLFEIVALYAAILMLLYVLLSVRVARTRFKQKVGVGDGGDEIVLRAVRVHGNFMEYVPLALVGMIMMASLGAAPNWLHGIGIALTVGRFSHAIGLTKSAGPTLFRVVGMILTWGSIAVMAIYLLLKILG